MGKAQVSWQVFLAFCSVIPWLSSGSFCQSAPQWGSSVRLPTVGDRVHHRCKTIGTLEGFDEDGHWAQVESGTTVLNDVHRGFDWQEGKFHRFSQYFSQLFLPLSLPLSSSILSLSSCCVCLTCREPTTDQVITWTNGGDFKVKMANGENAVWYAKKSRGTRRLTTAVRHGETGTWSKVKRQKPRRYSVTAVTLLLSYQAYCLSQNPYGSLALPVLKKSIGRGNLLMRLFLRWNKLVKTARAKQILDLP